MKKLRRFRQHLSSKIALVFILSMMAIFLLHMFTTRALFGPKRFPAMIRVGIDHAQTMANSIGIPPDLELARELHQRLGIQIRIESEKVSWVSNIDMIRFDDVKLEAVPRLEGTSAGFTPHGFCIGIERQDTRFLFVLHPKDENIRKVGYSFILILLFYTGLVLVFLYLIIKWLLRDIKVLDQGMQQISSGNLDHRMSSGRRDELGQLVHSFNTMTEKIQEMIRIREQLLLDVSHELRSPLTRIRLALEFMEEGESKKTVLEDVNELEAMIGELLEVERLRSAHGGLRLEKHDIRRLVEETCTGFKGRSPGIILRLPSDEVRIPIDPDRFKTALRNLLDNALRYSPAEGRPVEIGSEELKDEIVIRVKDYGSGIPAEEIPHIFEPFYRVDKSRSKKTGGYGLGLNMVHKIVSAHGGRMEVQSVPGQGSTIAMRLPRLD